MPNAAIAQQIDSVLREATKNPTDFLNLAQRIIAQAKQAGVTEQQLLDQMHNWYEGTSSTGN